MSDVYLFVIMISCLMIYGLLIYRYRHYLLGRRNNETELPIINPIRDCKIAQ